MDRRATRLTGGNSLQSIFLSSSHTAGKRRTSLWLAPAEPVSPEPPSPEYGGAMLVLYVGALILAVGVLALQLFMGHHGGADADAGAHDASGHDADHDTTFWTFVASVRFWTFALLAFGLVGTMLTLFGFAGPLAAALLASGTGVASGAF